MVYNTIERYWKKIVCFNSEKDLIVFIFVYVQQTYLFHVQRTYFQYTFFMCFSIFQNNSCIGYCKKKKKLLN